MRLNIKTFCVMVEVVLGVLVFALHFVSEINATKATLFVSVTTLCSPIIPQLFRADLVFLEVQFGKGVDYFIMVYALVCYIVGSIVTLIDAADMIHTDARDAAIAKAVFAIAIVVAIIVELVFDLIKKSGGGRGGGRNKNRNPPPASSQPKQGSQAKGDPQSRGKSRQDSPPKSRPKKSGRRSRQGSRPQSRPRSRSQSRQGSQTKVRPQSRRRK